MKKTTVTFLIFGCFIFNGHCAGFDALNDELTTLAVTNYTHEELLGASEYASYVATGNSNDFLEMCAQSNYPLVAVAGFVGINKFFTNLVVTAISEILSTSIIPRSDLMGPLYQRIHQMSNEELDSLLVTLSTNERMEAATLGYVNCSISADVMDNWYHSPDRSTVSTNIEAVIVDELFAKRISDNEAISSEMTNALTAFSVATGTPLRIFALWADESYLGYTQAMTSILIDTNNTEDELRLLVYRKYQFITNSIDLDSLGLDADRKAYIETVISRASQ